APPKMTPNWPGTPDWRSTFPELGAATPRLSLASVAVTGTWLLVTTSTAGAEAPCGNERLDGEKLRAGNATTVESEAAPAKGPETPAITKAVPPEAPGM